MIIGPVGPFSNELFGSDFMDSATRAGPGLAWIAVSTSSCSSSPAFPEGVFRAALNVVSGLESRESSVLGVLTGAVSVSSLDAAARVGAS